MPPRHRHKPGCWSRDNLGGVKTTPSNCSNGSSKSARLNVRPASPRSAGGSSLVERKSSFEREISAMDKISVADARKPEAVGRAVRLQGWIRTRRDSKGGFSFLEINDGSCFGNVQVIADAALAELSRARCKHLSVGSSVDSRGDVQASPAKGQATEVKASKVVVHGTADPVHYPLQKKGHSFEFLRTIAHLRPRTQHLRRRSRASATRSACRSTTSSRSRASSTSTRRSSRPATAKGPARCSASPRSTSASCRATTRARSTCRRTSSANRRI